MKKIIGFGIVILLITASANAQPGRGRCKGRINPREKQEIRMDMAKVNLAERRAGRDGVVTPFERMRIRKLKAETRRDIVRSRHNGRI